MATTGKGKQLSDQLAQELPYLRRYARALAGSQTAGDRWALSALQGVLDQPDVIASASSVRVGLFATFSRLWGLVPPQPPGEDDDEPATLAQKRLQTLTPESRKALLLVSVEQFSTAEVAEIMRLDQARVEQLIKDARTEIKQSVKGRILVIEDEAMIAMDLNDIVTAMGHDVLPTAATRDQAIEIAAATQPDLILSDIQLADGSSGIDAVSDILRAARGTPVIFITAFPERLLTGKQQEPAFLITKPYSEDQVISAISQAMFFRSSAFIEP